ncbi:pseudouridine synthase [Bacteroidia bacterium]|nr:pseudouridine synthase [Bacteroidia bacterium]
MITEDWTPDNDGQQSEDGYNRERKPLKLVRPGEPGYGSATTSNYGTSGGTGDYERGGYHSRPSGNNYERRDDGGSYNRPRSNYNSYDRQEGGYNSRPNYNSGNSNGYDRPARPYTPRPYNSEGGGGYDLQKKRRPRVGEDGPADRFASNRYPSSNDRYQSNDRYPSNNDRYQSNDRYPSNNRYQSNDRYPSNNRFPNNNRNPQQQQQFDKFAEIKKSKYREEHFDPEEPLRLNKYLANAGVCSRREADEFIKAGVVKVNGTVITELGTKVKRADEVVFHDQPVRLEAKMYIVLNKPKNCVTTADDPQERLTVMDLVKTACHERIFPVGRLDRNTTGVLLLTNDGDLASKLTHPKYAKKKIYHVWLDKDVTIEDMEKLAKGIELEDGEIHADAISFITEEANDQVGIEIHSGRNRVVRRMFESLGYHVIKLDRVYFAGMTKKNLKRGHWRYLTETEVNMLRQGAFE